MTNIKETVARLFGREPADVSEAVELGISFLRGHTEKGLSEIKESRLKDPARVRELLNEKQLSKLTGKGAREFTEELLDEAQAEAEAWFEKKGYLHPVRVMGEAGKLARTENMRKHLKRLGMAQEEGEMTAVTLALVHDLGRLAEIDRKTGLYKAGDHALESVKILKEMGCDDPVVLLAVKYHDAKKLGPALEKDGIYMSLPPEKQSHVRFFSRLLRDADKAQNIREVAEKGLEGRLEMMPTSKYTAEVQVTPAVREAILKGESPDRKDEKTHIDALLRFASWASSQYFFESRQIAKGYVEGIFGHIKESVRKNAKSEAEYASTMEDVAVLHRHMTKSPAPAGTAGCDQLENSSVSSAFR